MVEKKVAEPKPIEVEKKVEIAPHK